jgi:hypothetical protein
MRLTAIIILQIIPLLSFSQQSEESLSKYSYLIYGSVNSKTLEKGTGFFIRNNGKLFLLTANHVLTGWDCNHYYHKSPFPDTMYVRVNRLNSADFDFIPINISKFKRIDFNYYYYQKPDICIYEMSLPKTDTVYSIEKLLMRGSVHAVDTNIVAYGFPIIPAKTKNDIILTHPTFAKATAISVSSNVKEWRHPESGIIDSINYQASIISEYQISGGFSGAPVFLKSQFGYFFAGVINGGTDKAIIIVRPRFIYMVKPLN